ncbi:hypothetical protein CI109_103988 [Kwoniella shandongensis]|uniref:Uncharacterized protein n=1 Tax=Kwoniella shandongensis TaxID=1734106 RepID=A0A5M6BXJ8_9TREE|nr:uncharacterized protein CI109_004127 [Kwoniella shandongensis]KAA5527588.1 hypothetical protein CI109_004127 [Kwoniella shandongensis]
MDDPWAAPSWSTPAKPTSSIPSPERASATPPPSGFDVGDPWGVTTPGPSSDHDIEQSAPIKDEIAVPSHNVSETEKEALGGGWGESHTNTWGGEESVPPPRVASPPPSGPRGPDSKHEAVWTLNTPPESHISLPSTPTIANPAEISLPHTPTPDVNAFTPPPLQSITSPTRSVHSAYASPARSIHDEMSEGFGESSSHHVTNLPKSPSFGDDFGGFSEVATGSGDPWGGRGGGGPSTLPRDDSWGGGLVEESETIERPGGGGGWGASAEDEWGGAGDTSFGSISAARDADPVEEVDGDGWGGSRPAVPVLVGGSAAAKAKEDDEWEEAQRRIRLKQQLAPQERIDALAKGWTELASSIIQVELEKTTGAEEIEIEKTIKTVLDDAVERLRSLSTIPSDINTYPPVISSLVTHERFVYALQRPNPAPSTSFLTAAANRRPRRTDTLGIASSSTSEPSWTTRSRLGEPDAPLQESSPMEEGGKSRWSFWGKRPQPERQLTTSGGGVLEVKSVMTSPALERTSSDVKPPSLAPSRAASISGISPRPPSPAPPSLSPTITHDDAGRFTPNGSSVQASPAPGPSNLAAAGAPAPSAVSRFFGRLSRKSSATPNEYQDADDAKDLELSADDFSFLSEVPSMSQPPPEKGVGDLLALEPGRTEQIASLESLLNAKPAPLPKPLAPPPRGSAPMGSRTSSGKFVARMKAPAPTDFDLLGGLDFAGPSTQSVVSTTVQSPVSVSSPSSAWDDFLSLAPSAPTPTTSKPPPTLPAPSTPTIAAPLVPSRSGTPSVSLSPPPHSQPAVMSTPLSFSSGPSRATPTTPKINDFGDDFDDFGTPQQPSTATFDDFGDFSAFESKPTPAVLSGSHSSQIQTPLRSVGGTSHKPFPGANISTPVNHSRPGSLDHSPTINLLSGASASKGKRWPAPASPVAPILEPPPKAGIAPTASAGFPFLSPPPPGRPSSRTKNDLLGDANTNDSSAIAGTPETKSTVAPTMGMGINYGGPGTSSSSIFGNALAPAPAPRSNTSTPSSMLSSPPSMSVQLSGSSQGLASSNGAGKGGLSAQDLSFFDSL